jgi:hypothetical protein
MELENMLEWHLECSWALEAQEPRHGEAPYYERSVGHPLEKISTDPLWILLNPQHPSNAEEESFWKGFKTLKKEVPYKFQGYQLLYNEK